MIIEPTTTMQKTDTSVFGKILYIDYQIAIIKIPMNGSCAIPLAVIDPASINLFTWSFVGFSGQNATDPYCILVLDCRQKGAFPDLSSVSLFTHVGVRYVNLTPELTPLSRLETSIVAKAVVSSWGPESLARFGALIAILGAGLDAILAEGSPSDPIVRASTSADTWLANRINFVPDCMIVRTSAGYTCSPIASVRFHTAHECVIKLTTGISLNSGSVNGGILSGLSRYTAFHVVRAM